MNNTTEPLFSFSRKSLTFLADLEKNNNKVWFDSHKEAYRTDVLEPMKTLVLTLGSLLSKKLTGLHYKPSVNSAIFRIYRDTRFSKDKRPYKTHAAAFLWVGTGKKLACPGIYFHLEADKVMLGSGVYMFAPETIEKYRKFVDNKGLQLSKSIQKAEKFGFELGGECLKRVPRGFPADHKWGELLKMKGLYVSKTFPSFKVTKGDVAEWINGECQPTLDVIRLLEKALYL